MYLFSFCIDGKSDSFITLPVSPAAYKTKVGNKNKTIELVKKGEFNIIKDIGLREFSFKILLPKNNIFAYSYLDFKEPLYYLIKFREYKENKKPVRFDVTRVLPDGRRLFGTNLLVSFEDYTIDENAGEEGDFWVDIKLKEYRPVEISKITVSDEKNGDNKTIVSEEKQRETKDTADTYTVKKGDSLWKIAKLQLNDGGRYKEIAELNNISDVNKIYPGMVLKLP